MSTLLISKKIDNVIAGENAGSKLEKAEKLGVTILAEEQAVAMLESKSTLHPGEG
ncbi:MAG: hypothetical protein NUW37_00640 [Planctomycetes bacterium]|nr:hypothetical protein [Planctomycetota bacterium]